MGRERSLLSDRIRVPRVIDLNPVVRWPLLNLIIPRTRPAESAQAYKKVWTQEGSRLLAQSKSGR